MPCKYKVLNKRHSILLLLSCLILPGTSHAVWFEASGQAIVEGGNKEIARQRATQEAIKQAMLFAGAKVSSVQKMANGLLQDDRFEIRSSGEVSSIELIDEQYDSGYVTVSIRADIFPQDARCQASDYQKSIVTTWYPIRNRQQAAAGSIYDLGKPLAQKLQQEFDNYARYTKISQVEPYYLNNNGKQQAIQLARKTGSQFVLMAEISELSLEEPKSTGLKFWQSPPSKRHFALDTKLYDGTTGALVMDRIFTTSNNWEFEYHQAVDVNSQHLWRSSFGVGIQQLLQEITQQVDEKVSCLASYGRILEVKNEQIKVSIGSEQGVKKGDILSLFQTNQFYDPFGQLHHQYKIHPIKVKVTDVYHDTAILMSENGIPLANIQANDFVARR